mgnify:CR=1 FL=1
MAFAIRVSEYQNTLTMRFRRHSTPPVRGASFGMVQAVRRTRR